MTLELEMPTWESGCLSLMCFGFGKLWTLWHFDRNKPRNICLCLCHDVPRNWGCTDISDLEVILRQGRVAGTSFFLLLYHLSKWFTPFFAVYLAINSKIRGKKAVPKEPFETINAWMWIQKPLSTTELDQYTWELASTSTIDIPDFFVSFL